VKEGEMGRYAPHTGEIRNTDLCRIWVLKLEGKGPPRRPMNRWENNFKMDLKNMHCGLDSSGS
jgi:hypothetical protein